MALLALTTSGYAYLVGPLLRFVYASDGGDLSRVLAPLPASWSSFLTSTSRAIRASDDSTGDVALALALALLVVSGIKGSAMFGERQLMARIGQEVVRDLRVRLFDHLLTVRPQALLGERRGDVAARVSSDVLQIQTAVTWGVASIARDVLQLIALVALAVRLDPVLAGVATIALPIVALSLYRLSRRLRRLERATWDQHGKLYSVAAETVGMVPLVRAYGAEPRARRVWRDLTDRVHHAAIRASRMAAMASPLTEMLGAFAIAGTLGYASMRIRSGELTPETFVSFFAAIFLLYAPIKGLGATGTLMAQGLAALDRMDALLRLPAEPADPTSAEPVARLQDRLELRDVHAGYVVVEDGTLLANADDDDAPAFPAATGPMREVLKGVSFHIAAGESVAVVGPSGAGKTTLVSVLLRLLEPTSGEITWDGVPVSRVSRASLRAQMAWVTQEPLILADTVLANIAFADESPDRARVEAAARGAAAHGFIEALPKGYDTAMAEAGARLSVGQRQRICIARALYRDASLIVFDEPTSALDGHAERELAETLEKLVRHDDPDAGPRPAALIISHRLSTVMRADRAVVLDDGRIVESGRPSELMERGGVFTRLFR